MTAMPEELLRSDVVELDTAVLGRRIRAVRRAAGLTQADIAGAHASVAYISRIEAGQRRPSRRVLVAIAAELGVPPDEFTNVAGDPHSDLRVRLGLAEQHLAEGSPAEAFNLASEVAVDADAVGLRALADQATYVRAAARRAQASSADAVEILGDRFGDADGEGSPVRVCTLFTWCHLELGQVARAIARAEQGARWIATYGLHGLPEALEHAAAHAHALLLLGEPERAEEVCRQAVLGSARLTTPGDLSSAYRTASVREAEAGAVSEAATHFDLARAASHIELYETYLEPLREQLSSRERTD